MTATLRTQLAESQVALRCALCCTDALAASARPPDSEQAKRIKHERQEATTKASRASGEPGAGVRGCALALTTREVLGGRDAAQT